MGNFFFYLFAVLIVLSPILLIMYAIYPCRLLANEGEACGMSRRRVFWVSFFFTPFFGALYVIAHCMVKRANAAEQQQ